ncbi:MAG: UDP-N-acetyl-D-mannosaminuronic acid dehydrogenase [Chloroflexota bacterium]|jgi:UDP-N-acetyl-D-mannosaminuronic acid dehydrogenase|nr:UDP-N-acetyl-D-mannosaminuronic acid dehydrogenase [Chloroflexota bacterium]
MTVAMQDKQVRKSTPAADSDVCVVGGGGHVGLPLSLALADAGLRVAIYDTNERTVERIARGEMPFLETGAAELLAKVLPTGRLTLTSDPTAMRGAPVVIVVIGTPIDEFLNPSMTLFDRVIDEMAPNIADGTLVVMRSTVYPGTTERVARMFAERGRKVDVACCPERIAEGHALEELKALPQIVGADSIAAGDRAAELFKRLGAETVRTTTREAELAKLFTNAWRYMKFAIANQFLMIAHQAGADYNAVLHAIRHDYPRAADLPGPGFAAGPCLLKDTMQLASFTADHFPMGQSAMQINEGLPAYIVDSMSHRFGGLEGKTVGILGMAFKAESDDTRASLSYKLRKLLLWAGADVLCTDPYVVDDRLVGLDEVMAKSDILVFGAPHRDYRALDLDGREVVDVWGARSAGIDL